MSAAPTSALLGLNLAKRRMAQISTAHVSRETAASLDAAFQNKSGILWDELSYTSWGDYGWLFYTGCMPDDGEYATLFPDLKQLFLTMHIQGVEYLMLDCDASVIEGLPTWEW